MPRQAKAGQILPDLDENHEKLSESGRYRSVWTDSGMEMTPTGSGMLKNSLPAPKSLELFLFLRVFRVLGGRGVGPPIPSLKAICYEIKPLMTQCHMQDF